MKIKLGMQALGLLLVLALAGTIFVPGVSAESINEFDDSDSKFMESILLNTKLLDQYSELNIEEQMIVLTAIYDSTLTKEEQESIVSELEKIWNKTSKLSRSDQNSILANVIYITYKYYSPDETLYQLKWGGASTYYPDGVHNALAEIAGIKMEWDYPSGVHDTAQYLLNAHSKDPDDWGTAQMVEHYLDGAPSFSNAPDKCAYYANEAKNQLNNNIYSESGWRCLSWSMHYMSDMSMPWHTQICFDPIQLATHTLYEDYVNVNFLDPNYGFKNALNSVGNYDYYTIVNPASSARSLASYSSSKYMGLQNKMSLYPTDWGEDSWVKSTTRSLLQEGMKYNMGLIEYST